MNSPPAPPAIYLGLDCGTQSLNAIAIEAEGDARRVLLERSLEFDAAFPGYGTANGVFRSDDPSVVTSSPLLWAEALDRLMGEVAAELGRDIARVAAVSGSAQQHGSVYMRAGSGDVLAGLDPGQPLASQLDGAFAVEHSPVWMDTSTSAQCEAITDAVGGPFALAQLTGSRAYERFTGPQIRKLFETDPDAYQATERIHLVSSYLASLLAGAHAPVDTCDGSGMNLMDLARGEWADIALHATAPRLRDRLPPIVAPWTVVGRLSRYWVERYGFLAARLAAWTGDNPSSLVGLGVVSEGTTAISLGTSDTLFAAMTEPVADPSGAAHVFASPTGHYMSLVCFSNGSLARECVRDAFGLDWDGFSRALRTTQPGNSGAFMLPWFEPEITPRVKEPGVHRYDLSDDDPAANVRAVVEAQMLAMAIHSAWAAPRVERIHATGGAARNAELLQVMADVFDAPVYRLDVANSACLGAALRAFHADAARTGAHPSWPDVVKGLADPDPDSARRPRHEAVAAYASLRPVYAAAEAHALRGS